MVTRPPRIHVCNLCGEPTDVLYVGTCFECSKNIKCKKCKAHGQNIREHLCKKCFLEEFGDEILLKQKIEERVKREKDAVLKAAIAQAQQKDAAEAK